MTSRSHRMVQTHSKRCAQNYGFVISDRIMELMNGCELLRQIRLKPRLAATPFIMVTAETCLEHVIAARKAGVSSYISKQFNVRTLGEKSNKCLRIDKGREM